MCDTYQISPVKKTFVYATKWSVNDVKMIKLDVATSWWNGSIDATLSGHVTIQMLT